MGGFLQAEERCLHMKQRLEHYRRMTAPAAVAKPSFVIETVLEPVTSESPPPGNVKSAMPGNTRAAAPPESGLKIPGLPSSLFGIELTRDNCLIIALIIMLAKEKADIKLIIALIYLLL
jgi:hypothetical protein